MPHSSGGGSSSGGFHSGSSSSSSSSSQTRRYSSHYFPGALCYVYYDNRYRPHLMYADNKPESPKASWTAYLIFIIMFLLPIGLLIGYGFKNPKKLETNYNTEIVITDNNNVLTDEEELLLKEKFISFQDITGITPAFMSTDNKSTDDYESFEDYAYEQYVNTFKDEKHWLIVYFSRTGTLKENWGFEGMQGNDTDSILYEKVTNLFNETLYKSLKDEETTVSNAFIKAFDTITPDIMTPTFYMDTSGIIVCSLLGGFIVLFTVVQIINSNHRKNIAKAVQVDGTLELKTCAHCGNSYYANSVTKCPKCGHDVEFLHIPHID